MNFVKGTLAGLALSLMSLPAPALAQEASYIVTLGKDTVAV